MTIKELILLRKSLGYTQTVMSDKIGLSVRAYQEIESEEDVELSRIKQLAIEKILITEAIKRKNIDILPVNLRKELLDIAVSLYPYMIG